jgi:hypothetical protein
MTQYIGPNEASNPFRIGPPRHYRHDGRMKRTHCVTAATFGMAVLLITMALLGGTPIYPTALAVAHSPFPARLGGVANSGVPEAIEARAVTLLAKPCGPSEAAGPATEPTDMSYAPPADGVAEKVPTVLR